MDNILAERARAVGLAVPLRGGDRGDATALTPLKIGTGAIHTP